MEKLFPKLILIHHLQSLIKRLINYLINISKTIKFSETFHFADETDLLHFAKKNILLFKSWTWINTNKISLNARKTEFFIFQSKSKPLTSSPFLILGKKIFPSSSVKYLDIPLDKNQVLYYHMCHFGCKNII